MHFSQDAKRRFTVLGLTGQCLVSLNRFGESATRPEKLRLLGGFFEIH